MREWVLPADGTTAADLRMREVPVPEPAAGEVRIRVRAISINARDALILAGPFGRLPGVDVVPMSDLAGVIDAVGDGVTGWAPGDRAMTAHVPAWQDGPPPSFAQGPGSNDDPGVAADFVVAAASALVRSPDHLDDVQASTLQVAGVTAWNALFGGRPLLPGERVAVVGAGGVALFSAQIARALGATVQVVSRRDALDPRWDAIGVTGHVDSRTPGWGARLAAATGGVDEFVDTLGPGAVPEALAALRNGGEAAVPGLADLTAPTVDVVDMIGRQTSLRGVAVGSVRMHRDLAAFLERHRIVPVVDTVLPFERLDESYAALATRGLFGKVAIAVDQPSAS